MARTGNESLRMCALELVPKFVLTLKKSLRTIVLTAKTDFATSVALTLAMNLPTESLTVTQIKARA